MYKKNAIIFALSLLSLLVYCEDYKPAILYLTNGDSIKGLVSYSYNSYGNELNFKKAEGYLEKVYNVQDVNSFMYIYSGKKYIQETIIEKGISKPVFVEEVIKSKISLYVLRSDGDTRFYLKKQGNSRLINLPVSRLPETIYNGYAIKSYNSYTTNHKDTLRKYMDDAVEIDKYIDKIAYPQLHSLISLVKEYNSQFNEKSITALQLKTKLFIPEFSITPAIYYSTAAVNQYSNYFTMYYGVLLNTGVNYSKHQLGISAGLFMATFTQDDNFEELAINTGSLFKIPLLVKYQYDLKFFRPAVAFGLNAYQSKYYGKRIMPTIQVGTDVNLSKRFSVKLMPEFEFKIENSIIPIRYKVFNVLVGVSYSL